MTAAFSTDGLTTSQKSLDGLTVGRPISSPTTYRRTIDHTERRGCRQADSDDEGCMVFPPRLKNLRLSAKLVFATSTLARQRRNGEKEKGSVDRAL